MSVGIQHVHLLVSLKSLYLLHGTESFLKSQPDLSQSRNFPQYMEPEGSLLHSQVTATCPYQLISDKWVPVTTEWRVVGLRVEERPPRWIAFEYIE